eukprot:TRINITY_DN27306_c0_g1_i1.p1 TRINITY_DN27306_c0_g1~~TRINITY_DN27306_c0_g1_i1.p1  ORF type:complete len:533 (+),score=104.13 TRINITY_DN27306_c0_g1_i1:43-1641(+)
MASEKTSPALENDLDIVDATTPSTASPDEADPLPRKFQKRIHTPEQTRRLFKFTDPEDVKSQIRKSILSEVKPYNVFDFYYDSGIFQWLAKHPVFENMTLAVISLNAVYIAVDTDWNKANPLESQGSRDLEDSHIVFQIMEHFFCAYFTAEWIIRFAAFRDKCNCARDGWFVFDSLLVFMMVMETWVLTLGKLGPGSGGGGGAMANTGVLRLFRLLRLSRLLRMMRSLPQLMILVRGMMQAMTSVLYVMCLQVILTYIFAIACTQLSTGYKCGERYFANVAMSMYTLLIHATFMDDMAAFTDTLRLEFWPLLVVALVFVCLASLTLMNMLVGVLCEVVSAVATAETEEMNAESMATKMRTAVSALKENDEDHEISYNEFAQLMADHDAIACLKEQDVNPLQVVDLAEMFFFEDGVPKTLTFEEFMNMLMDLRETNQARVKDVWQLGSQIKQMQVNDRQSREEHFESLAQRVDALETHVDEHLEGLETDLLKVLLELQERNPMKRVHVDTSLAVTGTVKKASVQSVHRLNETF